jgi:hypothetical protein
MRLRTCEILYDAASQLLSEPPVGLFPVMAPTINPIRLEYRQRFQCERPANDAQPISVQNTAKNPAV